jgi:transketolase
MNTDYKKSLQDIATSVKILSMDAVQKANSGHPGLPMGCAEFGALLYGHVLHHYPKNPKWLNRDRFILSAGHGSMFLYSLIIYPVLIFPWRKLKISVSFILKLRVTQNTI